MYDRQYILNIVKQRIYTIDPNAKIILFGSRARDDSRQDSDWDFLILTNKKINQNLKNQISDSLFEAELETEQVLTSIIQNSLNWHNYKQSNIYQNINREGIEL